RAVQPHVVLAWLAAFEKAQLEELEVLLQRSRDRGLGLGRRRIAQEVARIPGKPRVLQARESSGALEQRGGGAARPRGLETIEYRHAERSERRELRGPHVHE